MSNPRYISKTLATADDNGIAESQTPLGAGNLTLNGALVTNGVAVFDTERQVAIIGNGNDSALTYTVYGTAEGGAVISEAVTGGNASPYTVATNQSFLTVTRISVSGATAAAIIAGTDGVGATPWQIVNWHISPINIGIAVIVTGTVNYTVQYTYDDPSGTYPNPTSTFPTAFDHPILNAQTATADSSISLPVAAIRLTNNSGTGTAQMVFVQGGIEG